jgi:hypothetical protein
VAVVDGVGTSGQGRNGGSSDSSLHDEQQKRPCR